MLIIKERNNPHTMISYVVDKKQKEIISSSILEQLPEWFGLPESTVVYIKESINLPFWIKLEHGKPVGFVALRENSPYTAEIYVMGILKAFQGKGIGKALFKALYLYAKEHGYSYLQVKTVEAGHYKEYDSTIGFYKSLGFMEFECLPNLWDKWNPCQIYIMNIS